MHMKKLQFSWGLLSIALFLAFSACQESESVDPALTDNFTASEFQLEDIDALENVEVTPATESAGFGIDNAAAARSHRHSLAFILPKLQLNERQRVAISGFAKEHEACIAEHRNKIQELHQHLLDKANVARQEYIKAYRAGRISKAVLDRSLAALRDRVKEEMARHDQKQMHLRVLRKCRADLMRQIESVLDREQRQLWNRWKDSL